MRTVACQRAEDHLQPGQTSKEARLVRHPAPRQPLVNLLQGRQVRLRLADDRRDPLDRPDTIHPKPAANVVGHDPQWSNGVME